MRAPGYLERVVLGEDRGLVSWIIRGALLPFTMLYCVGLFAFLLPYKLGLRKRYRLPVPVISVGNLTFGGTGKTPAVQTLCRMLQEQGRRVVVLSRGHGGSAKGALIVSDGVSIIADSAEAGDEPLLLAASLPGVPVVVGKDRRVSGRLACKTFEPDVIVLDDGMQYWQLHRDLEITVVNAAKPFGSGFVMPMGDLREPVSGLRRAGLVLVNAVNGSAEGCLSRVSGAAPRAAVFKCVRKPLNIRSVGTGKEHALRWIKGRRVLAFCGIGSPWSFIGMLSDLECTVACEIIFPDHHRFSDEDIARINSEHESCGAELVITTEKDAARLCSGSIPELYTLGIRLEIEDEPGFKEYITGRING